MATVAIIDDALLIRMQMKKFFEETLGFIVVAQGTDGSDGLSIYKTHKPDLMTIDLAMKNKGGLEAIKEILDHDPNARIIVVSATQDAATITQALKMGVRSFVQKPLLFQSEEFVNQLKEDIKEALA